MDFRNAKLLMGLLIATLVMHTGTASASLQMVGELGFTGSFETDTGNVGTATALSFPTASIDQATGDFVGIPLGDVEFTDFTFSPTLDPDPVTLWNQGDFSFDMTSVSIDFQNSSFLFLSGAGTLKGEGFTDTPGLFNFSGNTLGALFTFSAGNANDDAHAPEPTSLLIWGGLIAAGLMVKRRSRD